MFRRPAFWVAFAVLSAGSAALAVKLFPRAFPIVQLDITMDRDAALAAARLLMARQGFGPRGYDQAASFAVDSVAQTFVELEGGGKDAYARMLRDGLYSAYTWRVRHFREGEKHETLIRFRPDGRPYGFREQLEESAPGAALTSAEARAAAERVAVESWDIDLAPFTLVEPSFVRRPSGRIDHTFVYERDSPRLNDGRYRLRLVLSGSRLTEATHFLKIPEAFSRRHAHMRAANETLGMGAVVVMAVLYGIGGMAFGLFYLLRHRWVLARQPMRWGVLVAGLQLLASLNEWPLLWMTYDTALPRATFALQHAGGLAAAFLWNSVLFGLSFMAAESLSRRAFPQHPQLWRIWSRDVAASTPVLGCTVGAYLLVVVFLAYDMVLYFYATRLWGWWTPTELLIRPDVLASKTPWLSAIANSLQAGFWEESLFRAVPLAGAALIGDRFGQRRRLVVLAFIVQTILFGASHAPSPMQPVYARAVELLPLSIGLGLLYLAFGLLPAVVLHFAFDMVWFSIPLFVSSANSIWVDRAMVFVFVFVPLWIVVVARRHGGRGGLPDDARNAVWQPPPMMKVAEHRGRAAVVAGAMPMRLLTGCAVASVIGLSIWLAADVVRPRAAPVSVTRNEAVQIARAALAARKVMLDDSWRVMPMLEDGPSAAHRFVWRTAGDDRYSALQGQYLPKPRWRVRVATFEGDLVNRAEEWTVQIADRDTPVAIAHRLPQSRAAPSLSEDAARTLALQTVQQHFGLSKTRVREVSVYPSEYATRTDWTFIFQDLTVSPIRLSASQGDARIDVQIAGSEVVAVRPFVSVPEQWMRDERVEQAVGATARMVATLLSGSVLMTAAVFGVIGWSRRRFAVRVFVVVLGVVTLTVLINLVNEWPARVASFTTAQPFQLQAIRFIAVASVAVLIPAAVTALAAGALPRGIPVGWSGRTAVLLGVAVGVIDAGLSAAITLLGEGNSPAWPVVAPLGAYLPVIAAATEGIPDLLAQSVMLSALMAGFHHLTRAWTTRRLQFAVLMVVAGLLLNGAPNGGGPLSWLIAGALSGLLLLLFYILILRHDLSLLPVAVGTRSVLEQLANGVPPAYPGALLGTFAGVTMTIMVSWWLFESLRQAHAQVMVAANRPSDIPITATVASASSRT